MFFCELTVFGFSSLLYPQRISAFPLQDHASAEIRISIIYIGYLLMLAGASVATQKEGAAGRVCTSRSALRSCGAGRATQR
jgi:hypothetical protein